MLRKPLTAPATRKLVTASLFGGIGLIATLSSHSFFSQFFKPEPCQPLEPLYPPIGTPSPK